MTFIKILLWSILAIITIIRSWLVYKCQTSKDIRYPSLINFISKHLGDSYDMKIIPFKYEKDDSIFNNLIKKINIYTYLIYIVIFLAFYVSAIF
ncbi:MAG: hypothetical protein U9R42_14535 [Bacteroidota bacterium]|nr:hypothetical protein [Bacteroidota bacterium]